MTGPGQAPDGVSLGPGDFPGLFTAADLTSIAGQRAFLTGTAARALLAVTAALATLPAGASSHATLALVAAAAFLLAFAVELWVWNTRPELRWYDGRAIAESTKTLTWRYAVGALPFPATEPDPDGRFLDALGDLLRDAPDTGIIPSSGHVISPAMRAVRAAPLEQRRELYVRERVDDQRTWYQGKAERYARLVVRWRIALLAGEIAGVVLALCRAAGVLGIDAAGVVAAMVGAGAAWLAVRQYEFVRRAYTYAHSELSLARERLVAVTDEAAWAAEAADAEEAISREHTMWRASKSSLAT